METVPRRKQIDTLSKEFRAITKELYQKYIINDQINKSLGYFSICCLSFHSKGSNSIHGHTNCIQVSHFMLKEKETIENCIGFGLTLIRLAGELGYCESDGRRWTTVPEFLENAYHRVDIYSCVSTKGKSATLIMDEMNEKINELLIENKRLKKEVRKPK